MYQIPNCLLLTWERVVMKSVIDKLQFSEWAVQDVG